MITDNINELADAGLDSKYPTVDYYKGINLYVKCNSVSQHYKPRFVFSSTSPLAKLLEKHLTDSVTNKKKNHLRVNVDVNKNKTLMQIVMSWAYDEQVLSKKRELKVANSSVILTLYAKFEPKKPADFSFSMFKLYSIGRASIKISMNQYLRIIDLFFSNEPLESIFDIDSFVFVSKNDKLKEELLEYMYCNDVYVCNRELENITKVSVAETYKLKESLEREEAVF